MYQRMTCQEVYNYWNLLRGNENAPLRSAIEPANIRTALPDLFMLEAGMEGDLNFRLAGTRICGLFGRELRGSSFDVLWAGGKQSNAMDIARGVILYESPALMNLTGFTEDAAHYRFDMVLLPLRGNDGRCDRLLGALIPAAGEEKTPAHYTLACLMMDRSRPLQNDQARNFPSSGTRASQKDEDLWGLPVLRRKPAIRAANEEISWFSGDECGTKA